MSYLPLIFPKSHRCDIPRHVPWPGALTWVLQMAFAPCTLIIQLSLKSFWFLLSAHPVSPPNIFTNPKVTVAKFPSPQTEGCLVGVGRGAGDTAVITQLPNGRGGWWHQKRKEDCAMRSRKPSGTWDKIIRGREQHFLYFSLQYIFLATYPNSFLWFVISCLWVASFHCWKTLLIMYASGRLIMKISMPMSLRNHVLNKCDPPCLPPYFPNLSENATLKCYKSFTVNIRLM